VIITLGGRRMSLSHWYEGSESDQVRGVNQDVWLVGHRKIPAVQWAKLPRYWREGAVEVRPFPAKTRLCVSEAQGLSGEAVKGNPPTTVIPGVDESKPGRRTTEDLAEPNPRASAPRQHCRLYRQPLPVWEAQARVPPDMPLQRRWRISADPYAPALHPEHRCLPRSKHRLRR